MSKITQLPSAETGAQNPTATEQRVQRETVAEYLSAFGFDRTGLRSQSLQTGNPHRHIYGEGTNCPQKKDGSPT